MRKLASLQRGFSLIEMLMVVVVFLVMSAAVFGLLNAAQQRYKMESEVLETFQDARLAIDQIVRDVHTSGFPPANMFTAGQLALNPQRIAVPFGWAPGYPGAACTVNVSCSNNGGPAVFDLIIEGDIDPLNNNGIEWIRYTLNGTTLMRGVATKAAGISPDTATQPLMAPYIENVMNNTTPAQMTTLRSFYLGLFPGNTPVPMFTYQFDAGVPQTPANIRAANITLIVLSPNPDPKNQQPRVVTLTGYARRINPNQ